MSFGRNFSYARKILPGACLRALGRPASGPVHLIIALADHFEPSNDPLEARKHVSRSEQEKRLQWWIREYPKAVDRWRDSDGRPFVHTYF